MRGGNASLFAGGYCTWRGNGQSRVRQGRRRGAASKGAQRTRPLRAACARQRSRIHFRRCRPDLGGLGDGAEALDDQRRLHNAPAERIGALRPRSDRGAGRPHFGRASAGPRPRDRSRGAASAFRTARPRQHPCPGRARIQQAEAPPVLGTGAAAVACSRRIAELLQPRPRGREAADRLHPRHASEAHAVELRARLPVGAPPHPSRAWQAGRPHNYGVGTLAEPSDQVRDRARRKHRRHLQRQRPCRKMGFSEIVAVRRRGRPYVLCLGRRDQEYKNMGLLAKLAPLLDGMGLDLWMPGDIDEATLRRHVPEMPSNIVLLGRIADDDFKKALEGALCFLFPSRIEGFGLPAVEAMASGCPVVASTSPCLPEICGDLGPLRRSRRRPCLGRKCPAADARPRPPGAVGRQGPR
ncbi:glycosyltransferase (plasmid) [Mesorhizobium sp. AaZ16]|uniref:glycosyltransferase n=1 Tax=Mesorhizobium sp. AaZ16 TaxID=3402289 RepID=UPI00374F6CDD